MNNQLLFSNTVIRFAAPKPETGQVVRRFRIFNAHPLRTKNARYGRQLFSDRWSQILSIATDLLSVIVVSLNPGRERYNKSQLLDNI